MFEIIINFWNYTSWGDDNSVKEVSKDDVVDFNINIPPWCGIKVSSLAIHVTLSDSEQVRLSSSSISSGMGSIVSGEYCLSFTLIDHINTKN